MDTRKLKYFLAVVDHDGFNRAAEHLLIAQPSLSQTIASLEKELGVPLFHRIGRRAVLSEAGKELVGPARLGDAGPGRRTVSRPGLAGRAQRQARHHHHALPRHRTADVHDRRLHPGPPVGPAQRQRCLHPGRSHRIGPQRKHGNRVGRILHAHQGARRQRPGSRAPATHPDRQPAGGHVPPGAEPSSAKTWAATA